MQIHKLIDNSGSLGAIVSTMGCASCFPAAATLGSTLGLGFLAAYEGLFINTLLPLFALIAIISCIISFINHQRLIRVAAALAGPTMVLLTLYPLWTYDWSTYLFYAGLMIMFSVSIWDIISPAHRACANKQIKGCQ